MADILIRMEMPKTCTDCHDADLPTAIAWLGAKCPLANGIIDPGVYDLRNERHPDCPIHELPEHGDLIDRDALGDAPTYYGSHCNLDEVDDWINSAPVVIPANNEVGEDG